MNKEITELIYGIINASKKLKPGGRILVISFHSIEDRIIKYFFSNFSKTKQGHLDIYQKKKINTKALFEEYKNKALKASESEIKHNNRSRSAKLRFATRSNNKFYYPENLIEKFRIYLELEAINV